VQRRKSKKAAVCVTISVYGSEFWKVL
jgi:hypothetical protein